MSLAVPSSVLAFRYAAAWEGSDLGRVFESDQDAALAWLTDATGSRGEALRIMADAERTGSVELTAWGYAWAELSAWQYPTTQGDADDVAEYLAATYPVGTPVEAGDAMNRDIVNVGRISAHGDALVVAWTDGSTTEGQPFDMARMLTVADAPTIARAERAQAEAEAARIIARAAADADLVARMRANAEAERIAAEPIALDIPARVHRTDTFRATSHAGDMLSTHRFAFRTLSIAGRRAPVTAVVDPGWTAHDAADRALAYVVDTLGVSEAIALAAMLAAVAEAAQPWSNAGPVADLAGGVEVWCSAIRTND